MTGEPETFVVLPEGRRLMTLAWQGGGCVLLDGDSCGVHPARPLSCRLYPFDVALGKRGGIRRLQLLDTTDCPHEWGVTAPERSVAELHTMHRNELTRFAGLVSEFNQRQRHRARLKKRLLTAGDFLSFALQRSVRALPRPGGSPLPRATP